MWEEVLKLAVGNGLWAVLSCALLGYLLKDSKRREQKYTEVIEGLMEKMRITVKIKEDTEKILELFANVPPVISAVQAMPAQRKQFAKKSAAASGKSAS